MNLDHIREISNKVIFVIGNIVLLQVCNIVLFMTGLFPIVIPLIIMMTSLMIYQYIFEKTNFSFKNYIINLKQHIVPIIVYVIISNLLFLAFRYNYYMQTQVITLDLGIYKQLILIFISVILLLSSIVFILYFPLVDSTSDQDVMTKIKVTFIAPFFSFKSTLILILSSAANLIFFLNNALFLVVFGPVLLIASNMIIFKNLISNEESKDEV